MSDLPSIMREGNSPAINHDFRHDIQCLEAEMKTVEGSFIGDNELCPLKHTFTDGVYVREIFIPAGTLIVGKIHRHSHVNFISKGRVTVRTEEGVKELLAPLTMISAAGTKRLVYAHEDTIWTTIHVTGKTDLDEIEAEIIVKTYEEFDALQSDSLLQVEEV